MTINELIKLAIKKLPLGNNTSPALDGEVLLSFALNKPKEYLAANPNKKVNPKLEKKYLTLLNRRILGWPVAYLVKEKEFYKLKFYVDKKVLIPRPESEGLVELALEKIKKQKKKIKILDVGTGSGNIIIALAKNLRFISPPFKGETNRGSTQKLNQTSPSQLSAASEGNNFSLKGGEMLFFASDSSLKALEVAKKNAKLHNIKITFKHGNLLQPWDKQNFDVIIANLPYLHRETDPSTKFEPKGALIAAKKGLALYEQLFKQIVQVSHKPRFVFLEIGRDQGLLIKKLAKKFLPAFETKIYKDLWGKNRYARLDSTV